MCVYLPQFIVYEGTNTVTKICYSLYACSCYAVVYMYTLHFTHTHTHSLTHSLSLSLSLSLHPHTDTNPPVRLVCGHAISKDAMKKLVSHSRRCDDNSSALINFLSYLCLTLCSRLKCPYCPMEMLEGDVQEIKF